MAFHHHLFSFCNRLAGVQTFGASLGAVEDGVAAVQPEGVLKVVEAFAGGFVAAIDQPAVGLQQNRRAEVTVFTVPPVAWATG